MGANPDCWKDLLLESMGVNLQIRTLVRLINDSGFTCEEDRIKAFVEAGMGSRATYFRWKKEHDAKMCEMPSVAT